MNVKGLRNRLVTVARAMPGPDPLAVLRERQAVVARVETLFAVAIEKAKGNQRPPRPIDEEQLKELEGRPDTISRMLARQIREHRGAATT